MVTSQREDDQVFYQLENAVNQTEFMDQIKTFFLNSRDMFLVALSNMSHYLPLSVRYAVEVGRECDIVEYNKHYYTKAGLIIAGILVLIGIVFCFFGELESGMYDCAILWSVWWDCLYGTVINCELEGGMYDCAIL